MDELIRKRVLLDEFEWLKSVVNESSKDEVEDAIQRIKNAPAVDAVSKSLYDQIKWERDIALSQLEEIGLSLGQIVDDANVVPRKHYEELREDFVDLVCSGTNNPAPYCKNRRDECVDCYGYCTYNNCNGFNPDGGTYD